MNRIILLGHSPRAVQPIDLRRLQTSYKTGQRLPVAKFAQNTSDLWLQTNHQLFYYSINNLLITYICVTFLLVCCRISIVLDLILRPIPRSD